MLRGPAPERSRGLLALRLLFLTLLLPLALGFVIVTYQDAGMTHLPGKTVTAQLLRQGKFPFVFAAASCSQPLAGNPNFGTFFPDTLLLLLLPIHVVFGLHFALAAAIGLVGARRWARSEGVPRTAAEVAAFAFVFSGVFVSTWKFYNSGMALACAPWVMAAVTKVLRRADMDDHRGAWRGSAEVGLWAGLEIVAGEPVLALLTFVLAIGRCLVAFWAKARRASALGVLAAVSGLALSVLLAAPQIASTLQVFGQSSRARQPFPYVIAAGNSVHPLRLVEQILPFPFGRPDVGPPEGFSGHRFFDGHPPYLWTLHIGLVTIGLVVAGARPWGREERFFWLALLGAGLASLGRFLPGAKRLYPFLSIGGRIRFPVKWWYVVALCFIPLVGHAARRWEAGTLLSAPRRAGLVLLLAVSLVATFLGLGGGAVVVVGPLLASLSLLATLVWSLRGGERPLAFLACGLVPALFGAGLPLFLAVIDVVPAPPPRLGLDEGRLFSRISVEAHPLSEPHTEETTREYFRRARKELWPLTGGEVSIRYAFDDDPDGSYSDDDRMVRKAIDGRDWPEKAPELRLAGVRLVASEEALPAPYRETGRLGSTVRLYALDGLGSVRVATRFFSRRTLEGVLAHHQRPDFDPATDVVLLGEAPPSGRISPTRLKSVREGSDQLDAEVEADSDGLLVWSRTFFGAWRAAVDGHDVGTVVADGHFVGVRVPAGVHRVEIRWSRTPLCIGIATCLGGVAVAAVLRRRRD